MQSLFKIFIQNLENVNSFIFNNSVWALPHRASEWLTALKYCHAQQSRLFVKTKVNNQK